MPTYTVTDPKSGKSVKLTGDSPPTEAELNDIFAKIGGVNQKTARAEDFMDPQPEGSAAGRFLSNAAEKLNPVTMVKGLYEAVTNPIDTAGNILDAQWNQGVTAVDRFKEGRYLEAAGHGAAALLPLLGPAAAQTGEQIGSGDVAGGLGGGAGLITGVLLPGAVSKGRQAMRARSAAKPPTPVTAQQEAAAFGMREGVPVDAATATGNPVLRGAQWAAERTAAGSVVAGKAKQAQAAGLSDVGERLAGRANAAPVTAEQSGQAVKDAIGKRATDLHAEANAAYTGLRAIEAKAPLPVDISPVKAAMKPVFDALQRERQVSGTLMGDKARIATALDQLLTGPDAVPLSTADSVLSNLKSFSRVDDAFRRTAGQGVAAKAVRNLETAVLASAKQGGPQAFAALMKGRAATVNKYKAIEVLDKLRDEPVGVYRQLTAPKDSGIVKLREVAREAPAAMPLVARGYLEDLLGQATSERGRFQHAAKLSNDWDRLGPQTKALLFKDPALVKDLDSFFILAKRMTENPNTSGTAFQLSIGAQGATFIANPLLGTTIQIAGAALAAALNSPKVTRLMTQGMKVPAKSPMARTIAQQIKDAIGDGLAQPGVAIGAGQIPSAAMPHEAGAQ